MAQIDQVVYADIAEKIDRVFDKYGDLAQPYINRYFRQRKAANDLRNRIGELKSELSSLEEELIQDEPEG